MLAVFALGSSGFKSNNLSHFESDTCFEDSKILVEIIEGEINIDNIDTVLWLTAQCEMNFSPSFYPWDGN